MSLLRIGTLVGAALSCVVACGEEPDAAQLAGEDEAAVLAAEVAPTVQGNTVQIRTATNFPLTLSGKFGTGCVGELIVNDKAKADGRLQVSFPDYKLDLRPPITTDPLIEKDCSIYVTVSGARGYRVAIQTVTFVGTAFMLAPDSLAQFNQTVWWSGRGPSQTKPGKEIPAGYKDAWTSTETYELEEQPVSECLTASRPTDEITISTHLMLFNGDTRLPASVALGHLIAEALPKDPTVPSVTVQLAVRPCN